MTDATKEQVKRATAIVSHKAGHGTGFLVLPNVLATNAHVIGTRPADELEAKFVEDDGQVKAYPVRLLAIDGARDLALLWVTDDKFARQPLELRTDLKAGDKSTLGVLGNPGQWGNGWAVVNSLTHATLSKELMAKDGLPFYELDVRGAVERKADARPKDAEGADLRAPAPGDKIKTGPGNSGGPVLDATGKAVGVLTRAEMKDDTPTGRFMAVPATDLKKRADGLGKPDGWRTLSRQATLIHAQNVALLYLWAEVEATATALDTRKQVSDIGRSGRYRLDRPLATADAECRKAYSEATQALAKSRQAVADAAVRTALRDDTKEVKEERNALERITNRHANLFGTVRAAATKAEVGAKEFDACIKEMEKYRKLIREEALKAGWDDQQAAGLARQALDAAKMPVVVYDR
jgi:Trypsin-like peptidase domain